MSEPQGHPTSGRIVGRYVLHDEIASGGMASVHMGRLVGPVGFSRTIAIKRLHPQLARDPEFAAKFLDEARLASRVRHANVVSVIDVASVADELFLVMEYVQGEVLSRLVRAAGEAVPIPRGIGLTIVADTLCGLHAAHETRSESGEPLRIVHRDVSPQNIIVGTDGVSRVLDFGVAKAASQTHTTGDALKGKLAYMSPEQYLRKPLDRRADIFAVSIVLWEVLTGRRLFASDEPAAVLYRILYDEIEPPSVYVPDLPPALDAIVMKGLQRDVDKRFATAHEMAVAIEACAQLARPPEIGAWVARTAGESLRQRAQRIAQIEGTTPSTNLPLPQPSTRAHYPSGEATMMLRDPEVIEPPQPSPSNRSPVPRRQRRAGAYVVLVAFAVGVLVLAASRPWKSRRSEAAAPALSAAGVHGESVEFAVPPVGVATIAPPPSVLVSVSAPSQSAHGRTIGPGAPKRVPRRDDDCSPPYYFDENGLKRFKPKCL
jgi:eukaryotic-like serine/threonine-protein kinase